MNTRNAKYNAYGTIDCEIDHPKFGWIPFTASPDDCEQRGKDIYNALIESGNIEVYVAPPSPTQGELLDMVRNQQKERLRSEKLDSMLSVEFAEIEAATNEADIEKVKLK